MKNPQFAVGMLFATAKHFKDAVKEYSILNRKEISFVKNEKWRVRAKCKPPCNWMVFASKKQGESTLQVKSLIDKHTNCRPAFYNKNVTSNWLSKRYVDNFRSNPQ